MNMQTCALGTFVSWSRLSPSELNVPLIYICGVTSCEFSSFRSSRQNSMKTSWKSSDRSQTTLLLDTTARVSPPSSGWVCGWLGQGLGPGPRPLGPPFVPWGSAWAQTRCPPVSECHPFPWTLLSPPPLTAPQPPAVFLHTHGSIGWLVRRWARQPRDEVLRGAGALLPSRNYIAQVLRPFGLRAILSLKNIIKVPRELLYL